MNVLREFLPDAIVSHIMDYIPNEWNHRFTSDVLPEIELGWRWVGKWNDLICTRCYCFGWEACGCYISVQLGLASYPEFISKCNSGYDTINIYFPWAIFKHLHPEMDTLDDSPLYTAYWGNYAMIKYTVKRRHMFRYSVSQTRCRFGRNATDHMIQLCGVLRERKGNNLTIKQAIQRHREIYGY